MGNKKKSNALKKAAASKKENKDEALTVREHEVMQVLTHGHSYNDIAAMLFITEGTVKQHVNKIYKKLGAKNRTQAINNYKEKFKLKK